MSIVQTPVSADDPVHYLFTRWRNDPGGTYQTWFLWEERLKNFRCIRRGIIALNEKYRPLLSNDFGAVAGALFDIGTGRFPVPPRHLDEAAIAQWEADLTAVRDEASRANKALQAAREEDRTHTDVQGWLRDIGIALGYQVWVAGNDRNRALGNGRLGDGCLESLPEVLECATGAEAIRLIDVLWLEPTSSRVAAAFEVEHTTSIYSGIVRMLDLALGISDPTSLSLFLVAPDSRQEDVRSQLRRPAFSRVADLNVRFIPYRELESHRESISRFGTGMKAIEAIARRLT